jgi:hypothetical protein
MPSRGDATVARFRCIGGCFINSVAGLRAGRTTACIAVDKTEFVALKYKLETSSCKKGIQRTTHLNIRTRWHTRCIERLDDPFQ